MGTKTGKKNPFKCILLDLYPLFIIGTLGIIIYSNSFDCSFHLDDFSSITDNSAIRDIYDVRTIWNFLNRRFVTYYTFALNYHFHGLDVSGYHVVNVFVHIVTSMLVWWLTLLTLSTPVMRGKIISKHKKLLALGCGLIFVSHPIQTQAVTYIVQRLTSLATLFYIASICFYLKARLSKKMQVPVLWFTASAVAALLGMLTKEIVFTLPFAILLYETGFICTERLKEILKDRKTLLYMIIPLLFTLIIPFLLKFNLNLILAGVPSQRYQEPPLTWTVYFMTQFRVIMTYIRLLFAPIHQNVDYDFPASQSFFELGTLSSFFLVVAIFITAVWLFPKRKLVSFGIVWFFLTLSVEAVKPLGNVIFEHRLYLPMFGFSIFFVSMIYHIFYKRHSKAGLILMAGLICCTSFLTYRRNMVWKDEISLWSDAVRKSPDKARPHYNLGTVHSQLGQVEKAIVEYRAALSIFPGYFEAHNNLGTAFRSLGRYEEAIGEYREVLRIYPNETIAYINIGESLSRMEKYDEAVRELRNAIRINPDYAEAYNNLGAALFNLGKPEEAVPEYHKALRLNPDYTNAYLNMGNAFNNLEKFDDAEKAYRSALRIDPDNPVTNVKLGNTLVSQGKAEEALPVYHMALRLHPDYLEAHLRLANCYVILGKVTEAYAHLNEVERLKKKSSR
ncbi:tetratricopeptide repeat protein [Candidatus Latescibacterota bacterium]